MSRRELSTSKRSLLRLSSTLSSITTMETTSSSQPSDLPTQSTRWPWSTLSSRAFLRFKTRRYARNGNKRSYKRLWRNSRLQTQIMPASIRRGVLPVKDSLSLNTSAITKGLARPTKRKGLRRRQTIRVDPRYSSKLRPLKSSSSNSSNSSSNKTRNQTVALTVTEEDRMGEGKVPTAEASTMPKRSSSTTRPSSDHPFEPPHPIVYKP